MYFKIKLKKINNFVDAMGARIFFFVIRVERLEIFLKTNLRCFLKNLSGIIGCKTEFLEIAQKLIILKFYIVDHELRISIRTQLIFLVQNHNKFRIRCGDLNRNLERSTKEDEKAN